jgi:hypothetical protein
MRFSNEVTTSVQTRSPTSMLYVIKMPIDEECGDVVSGCSSRITLS